jgi:hypothetical protein
MAGPSAGSLTRLDAPSLASARTAARALRRALGRLGGGAVS